MLSKAELKKLADVNITSIDKSKLIDLSEIRFDPLMPVRNRMENFLTAVKNPYCFLCGGISVKIEYSEQGKNLNEKLTKYFIDSKNR